MSHQRPTPELDVATSEVSAVAELARQAAGSHDPVTLTDTTAGDVAVRGWVLHNSQKVCLESLERFQDAPARLRGAVVTTEPDSFVRYVLRLASPATTVWVDQQSSSAPPVVTAVLNDHTELDEPGWRDHRVALTLRPTPLWAHWTGRDGKLTGQLEFAEHVEDGLAAIVRPAAADMLEIAQTFDASRSAQFRSATRIQNGEVQLRWEEDTQAAAGRNRQMEIPERFVLLMEPWPGATAAYEVEARLRYRLRDGNLTIGYRLDRVDEVMRAAVTDLRGYLTDALDAIPVHAGQAPPPVSATN